MSLDVLKMYRQSFILKLFLILTLYTVESQAQLTITAPVANDNIAACNDYFANKWGDELAMDGISRHGDLLDNLPLSEFGDIGSITYSSGIASIPTTGNTPYIRLLNIADPKQVLDDNITRYGQVAPIDTNTYRYLSFRMKPGSSSSLGYSVRWDTCPTQTVGYVSSFTQLASTVEDWKIYTIDLATATLGLGTTPWTGSEKCGISFYPIRNVSGATAEIDWMQLTPADSSCSNSTVSYTTVSTDEHAIFLDKDTDLSNGYETRSSISTGSGSQTFYSARLFPGTYNVFGVQSADWATLHRGNSWDMNEVTDLTSTMSSITVSGTGFAGGQFCGTRTTSDPWFYAAFPSGETIDSTKYRYLTMRMTSPVPDTVEARFLDTNGNFTVYRRFNIGSGTNIVTVDLAASPSFPSSGEWTGQLGGLRIDPGEVSGGTFCIDWISVASTAPGSEPSLAADATMGSGAIEIEPRSTLTFKQPDKRGGRDYFIDVRGNAANMDSASDVVRLNNVTSGSIKPGNSYTDNAGNSATADYLQVNSIGDGTGAAGDSQVFLVELGSGTPIDADKYKVACFSMHHPTFNRNEYQSMVRFIWDKPGGSYYAGDDMFFSIEDDPVRRGRGKDTDYCIDLSTIPIEADDTTSVYGDFWKGEVDTFRIDPHEESTLETSYLKYVRLSTYHLADQSFAIVVEGTRTEDVSLYYSTTKGATSGGSLITTIGANRNSDVHVWDVRAIPANTYYLYATIAGNTFKSDNPIIVDHTSGSAADSEAPILNLFAPASDGSGNYCALDLAGYAVDNRRIATIEVFIDNNLIHTFSPYKFYKPARDQYPNYPYVSESGFQESINMDSIASGVRQLRVEAWDTAGNKTSVTTNFNKECSTPTAPITWPSYNENEIAVPITTPAPTPTPYPLALKVSKFKGVGVQAVISKAACSVSIRASTKKSDIDSGRVVGTGRLTSLNQKVTLKAKSLSKVKGSGKFYLKAYCTDASGSSSVKSFSAASGGTKKIAAVVKKLRLK